MKSSVRGYPFFFTLVDGCMYVCIRGFGFVFVFRCIYIADENDDDDVFVIMSGVFVFGLG